MHNAPRSLVAQLKALREQVLARVPETMAVDPLRVLLWLAVDDGIAEQFIPQHAADVVEWHLVEEACAFLAAEFPQEIAALRDLVQQMMAWDCDRSIALVIEVFLGIDTEGAGDGEPKPV